MEAGITYEQAKDLFEKHITDPAMRNHCREAEVVMRALAKRLGENEGLWGIAGLLHDIDYESTKEDLSEHGHVCKFILKEAGTTEELIEVICSHVYGAEFASYPDKCRKSKFEHALAAGETVTGLIYAYGLMRPDKKLEGAKLKSLKKKFKDKSFASNVNRDIIRECECLDLTLDEFLEIALNAMKEIAGEIGL